MPTNLATLLTDTAKDHGDQVAIRLDDLEIPYSVLDDLTARAAALLRSKGLQPGDRVGVMLPNVPYFAIAYYGVLRAGGVVVPMNVLLKGREVAFYLRDPEAKLMFAWHQFADAAAQGAQETGSEVIAIAPGEFDQQLAGVEPATDVVDREPDDTAV